MRTSCLLKRCPGLLRLTPGLLGTPLRNTHQRNYRRQLLLIRWRMKAAIKGSTLDLCLALLQLRHLRNDRVLVGLAVAQDVIVADETHGIFNDQQLVTKLNRLWLLATID